MANATASREANFKLLLKNDDQPARELVDLDRSELELLRNAVESTLAQRSTDERESGVYEKDAGFSCEWWPPN
jgi:hypothetical protein